MVFTCAVPPAKPPDFKVGAHQSICAVPEPAVRAVGRAGRLEAIGGARAVVGREVLGRVADAREVGEKDLPRAHILRARALDGSGHGDNYDGQQNPGAEHHSTTKGGVGGVVGCSLTIAVALMKCWLFPP